MHLASIKITSYKSYLDSEIVAFDRGFNVVVGRNNAGKSAFVEALSNDFKNNPTRTGTTVVQQGIEPANSSVVQMNYVLSSEESRYRLAKLGPFRLQCPPIFGGAVHSAIDKINKLLPNGLSFYITYTGGSSGNDRRLIDLRLDGFGQLDQERGAIDVKYDISANAIVPMSNDVQVSNRYVSTLFSEFSDIASSVYIVGAERPNLGRSSLSTTNVLAPNASNLAKVLDELQRNPEKLRRFNDTVHCVFPEILQVSVQYQPSDYARIMLWEVDPKTEREDLAVPLEMSGTGVGQVLAILCLVFTIAEPRTIVIDEPQVYLHPGAIRSLMEVLRSYPQHQYIITTHSPAVITALDPDRILIVRKQSGVSTIETIDRKSSRAQADWLSAVGARLSDVFGHDRILWVEGETEEKCFKQIAARLLVPRVFGREIVAIRSTGDLESKNAERIFEIYNSLSQGGGLIPPARGFLLDRETRNEDRIEGIRKRTSTSVEFLPRRMYECYLLYPGGLAALFAEIWAEPEAQPAIETKPDCSVKSIHKWLDRVGKDNRYFGGYDKGYDVPEGGSAQWYADVDGGKLLHDAVKEFGPPGYSYQKLQYGEFLTAWLIDNAQAELADVTNILRRMLSPDSPKN